MQGDPRKDKLVIFSRKQFQTRSEPPIPVYRVVSAELLKMPAPPSSRYSLPWWKKQVDRWTSGQSVPDLTVAISVCAWLPCVLGTAPPLSELVFSLTHSIGYVQINTYLIRECARCPCERVCNVSCLVRLSCVRDWGVWWVWCRWHVVCGHTLPSQKAL